MAATLQRPPTLVAPAAVVASLMAQFPAVTAITLSTEQPAAGPAWRFETAGGEPVEWPISVIRHWERAPYVMLVRLVASQPASRILAEAVVGTRSGLDALQDKVIATMALLLRAAMSGRRQFTVDPLAAAVARPRRPAAVARLQGRSRRFVHVWRDRLFVERWSIGIVAQSAAALIAGEPLRGIDWVDPDRRGNLADPHPWPGTTRILCEEFASDGGPGPRLGQILALELDAEGRRIVGAARLLGGALHRSYPGALVHESETLLLPETPDRGETTIYRMTDAGKLEPLCGVATHLRMGDPTLFWHGGRAWIAYSDLDIGAHDNLCLLSADTVRGPWREHRGNPVKLDVRCSRPAGPVLRHGGRLYRPAQDCARTYGAAVVLHRIETLTLDEFSELPVCRIEPSRHGPYPDGLHTLSSDGARLLVDGKRQVVAWRGIAAKLRRRAAPLSPRTPIHA